MVVVLTGFGFLLGKRLSFVSDSLDRDYLTHLYNQKNLRLYLDQHLELLEGNQTLSLLIFDIDHFKNINDEKGHLAGDKLIVSTAMLAQTHFGHKGRVFRWGGDEFCVVLLHTDASESKHIFEQFQALLKKGLGISVSCGISSTSKTMDKVVLFEEADKALYEAKKARSSIKIHV